MFILTFTYSSPIILTCGLLSPLKQSLLKFPVISIVTKSNQHFSDFGWHNSSFWHRQCFPPLSKHIFRWSSVTFVLHSYLCAPSLSPAGSFVYVVQSLSCVRLFCNPMDYSPPGSSVHDVFQARILEWVAISFFRRCSRCRDWTHIPFIGIH